MDVVIIANAWDAARDNPTSKHQIAMELVRMGHRVLWLEGAGMRRPSFGSGADRGRMVRKVRKALRGARSQSVPGAAGERLWVAGPLLIPLPRYAVIRRINGWLFRAAALRTARKLAFVSPVLINYVPVLAEAMLRWPTPSHGGVGCVYHRVDRWDQFDMYHGGLMRAMDARCHELADVVITSSRDLFEHSASVHERVTLVNHGVDHARFAAALTPVKRPADLPGGAVVGFFGLLSEWVDQELLVRLADALREVQIVLIGRPDVPIDRLKAVDNIHVLGPRPFAALPCYVGHFAVGIIPFKVSRLTRAVNPIKLREMLAAGCPVVSTELPEVEAYATNAPGERERPGVVIARDYESFVSHVRDYVQQPLAPEARRRLSDGMLSETWRAKTEEILAVIRGERDA